MARVHLTQSQAILLNFGEQQLFVDIQTHNSDLKFETAGARRAQEVASERPCSLERKLGSGPKEKHSALETGTYQVL